MRRVLVALALCLAMVGLMATPVMAESKSVGAVKADIVNAENEVVGFAVFNTNGNDGLNAEVVVKDLAEDTYALFVQAPVGLPVEYNGTLLVGANGKGTAHAQVADLVYPEGASTIPCAVRIRDMGNLTVLVAGTGPNPVPVPLK